MAPWSQCDCGLFCMIIMAELQQLFEGHSVTLSYVWHLAASQQALHLTASHCISKGTMHPLSH